LEQGCGFAKIDWHWSDVDQANQATEEASQASALHL
jgi:hypothetical protein